jgi:transglutaminase-like putative cysteine protease
MVARDDLRAIGSNDTGPTAVLTTSRRLVRALRGRTIVGMLARALILSGLAAFIVSGKTASAQERQGQWRIAPEPTWVVPAPLTPVERAPADESVREYLLDDAQERVTAKTVERYRHIRFRPRSPAQVEEGSQVELSFDPAFERLVIHHARVERDGRAVAALAAGEVRLVQREKGFEELIYDGTLSALIFLKDVRVGDVVDYAYSVEGASPVLGGKYVTEFPVADRSYTASWRRRIVMPEARSLRVKNHRTDLAPTVTTGGGWRVYTWERREVSPIEPEDGLPSWFDPAPSVEAGEFDSWAEVAALFVRLYSDLGAPSPVLPAEIAKLQAVKGTAEDRLLAATRFVQDDIRYLGIELGLGGHRPFAPATVLERRFGDCKDKAVLLVTFLRALGFDAKTALVNTVRRRALDEVLPSPLAFDHAIVQVTVDGRSTFIDATSSYQRGPLSARQPPDFERALLVAPDTRALVPIDRPRLTQPNHEVQEILTVGADHHSADLEVETTDRGSEANRTRAELSARTRKELGRDYLNYYSQEYPTIAQTAELEVADDEAANVVVVRERYNVAELWKDGRHQLGATSIDGRLKGPRITRRSMPYAVEFPLNIRTKVLVRFPASPEIDPEMLDLGDDHLHFHLQVGVRDRELSVVYELQSLQDSVAPEKAQRFFQIQDEIRRRAGYNLHAPGAPTVESWLKTPGGVVGLILMSVVTLAGLMFGARSRRRFLPRSRFAAGESPATAIEVVSMNDLGARVEGLRCTCGSHYRRESAKSADSLRYDGRTLQVWSLACGECPQQRSIYFGVGQDDSGNGQVS